MTTANLTDTDKLTIDDFRARIDNSRVKCLICGFAAHSLTEHLLDKHSLTAGQYQAKFPKPDHDPRLFSPIVGAQLKALGRTPQKSTDFEDYLPLWEGPAQPKLPAYLKAFFEKAPKGTPSEFVTVPQRDLGFFFSETETKFLAAGVASGMNVYLAGPTGCGKTELVRQMHAAIGKPLVRQNLNGDATRASLVGEMRANPTRGTYFHRGALPLAMEAGATLLLDEIDYGPPHVLAVLNPVLEGTRELYLEETGELIKAKPGFTVVATGNTGGKGDLNGVYTGTEVLNTAFLDRFPVRIDSDYLPADVEIKMLEGRMPNSGIDIKKLVKFANEVRTAFKASNLSLTVSTRKCIELMRFAAMTDLQSALDVAVFNWLDADDKNLVKKIKDSVTL
jgi:cobaltochelatase CobS